MTCKSTTSVRGPTQEAAMNHFKTLAQKGMWKIAKLQSGQFIPLADKQRRCFPNTNQTFDIKKIPVKYTTKSQTELSTSKCCSNIHIFNRCNPYPTIKTATQCIPLHLNGKSCQFCSSIGTSFYLMTITCHLLSAHETQMNFHMK
jgi:hypothetical protein